MNQSSVLTNLQQDLPGQVNHVPVPGMVDSHVNKLVAEDCCLPEHIQHLLINTKSTETVSPKRRRESKRENAEMQKQICHYSKYVCILFIL